MPAASKLFKSAPVADSALSFWGSLTFYLVSLPWYPNAMFSFVPF